MTEKGHCPEISILSSFLDKELVEEEYAAVNSHVENCPACAGRLKSMEAGDRLVARNFGKSMPLSEYCSNKDCITSEAMASYLHDLLPVAEKARIEGHLDTCDACLSELTSLARTEVQLRGARVEPLPDSLRKRAEALWKEERGKERILRVVIRLAREGIEIVRDSLFPETASLQEVFATAEAYRATAKSSLPSGISVKRNLAGIQLSLLVEWGGEDRASLKIKIEDEKSTPLEGQRIFLRREQILVHSERTNLDGGVAILNLEPGPYQIGIPILEKEFYVDLDISRA